MNIRRLVAYFFIFGLAPRIHAFEVKIIDSGKIYSTSQSRPWLLLLHSKHHRFSGIKSEADGNEFFLSENGKRDPTQELFSNLKAIDSPGPFGRLQTSYQCAFPARSRFLFEHFSQELKTVKRELCPDFQEWIEALNPQSVSLIFSSYYAGNPASIFGHTLLRINSVSLSDLAHNPHRLTDYGINFAAATDTDGGALFAIKGLTGGYQGHFSLMPYYEKINEYVKNESRDLWEYHLNLNAREIRKLLEHFWELGYNNHFDYFFIDENCSYQLLWLLEVAKPEWVLTDDFPWYVLPADTIKALHRYPEAIESIHYRPSFSRLLHQRFANLSDMEKESVFNLMNGKTSPDSIDSKEILEAYGSFLRYKNFEKKGSATFNENLRQVLVARSKLPGPSRYQEKTLLPYTEGQRPDQSHGSQRLGIGFGQQYSSSQKLNSVTFHWNQGLHDLLAYSPGYPSYSQIDFLTVKAKIFEKQKGNWQTSLEHFKIFEITSLHPISSLNASPSYHAEIGFKENPMVSNATESVYHAQAGGGGALELISNKFLAFTLFEIKAFGEKWFEGFQFGLAPRIGFLISPIEDLKIFWQTENYRKIYSHFKEDSYLEHKVALSTYPNSNWDLRLNWGHKIFNHQVSEKKIAIELFYAY